MQCTTTRTAAAAAAETVVSRRSGCATSGLLTLTPCAWPTPESVKNSKEAWLLVEWLLTLILTLRSNNDDA
jgi:hypothetical protein